MNIRKYDYLTIILYLFFLLIGLGAAFYTASFPQINLSHDVGSARFPFIFSILLASLCGIGLMVEIFQQHQSQQKNYSIQSFINPLLAIIANIITIYLIEIIGFYLATLFFSVSIMLLLGIRNKYHIIFFNIGLITFVYLLFQQLLNVPLPIGLIFEG